MKNHIKLFLVALSLLLAPSLVHAQQYTLGQTTLSSKVGQGDTQIQLASTTGVYGYAANLQPVPSNPSNPQSNCYIDREELEIRTVPSTGTVVQVRRGVNGTTASAHASGQMVLCGPAIAFYTNDPGGTPATGGSVGGLACTTANVLVTPWINVRTGAQWLCSTITSTWIPGFGNAATAGNLTLNTAVASATTMTPSGPFFHLTGATGITTIGIPVGCNATAVGGCNWTAICDSTAAFTVGNNIEAPGTVTCVAESMITATWDAKNSVFIVALTDY